MASHEQVTINSRKYDLSIRRSWQCRLIQETDKLLVFIGEFDLGVEHPELGKIAKGTLSYEYYWLDRWYNIFRFHEPDGRLRNWYCNINMPPVFKDGAVDYVDLDIDILVWPNFRIEVLDRDEFEANALRFNYPESVRNNAENAFNELLEMIGRRCFPFTQ